MTSPLLAMRNIGKSFPGVRALDGVSFDVASGEIHALVGENGAGKSTLIKILSGVYPQGEYEGAIEIRGIQQNFRGVRDAEKSGVAVVFQELSLIPELSIAENIFLGRLPSRGAMVRWNDLHLRASALLKELEFSAPAETRADALGIGQQQLVEIAKALSHEAQILVLDEPTAALNDAESQSLFRILRRLRERGLGLIYISHRLDEVLELADRITVLRDGRSIVTKRRGEIDRKQLVAAMIGREISQVFPEPQRTTGSVALEVVNLSVDHPTIPGRRVLSDIDFEVRAGEVVGIAGLMGSGRTALLNVLFGSFPKTHSGTVRVGGKNVSLSAPSSAIASGMAFVTEDRKRLSLSLNSSIADNMSLAALSKFATGPVLNKQQEMLAVERMLSDLRVKAPSPEAAVGTLSGGNQQKVVLGRWLLNRPRVLLLDEPTRGIDIGAKQEIYGRIDSLAREGLALLVVSSEMEELRGICDRILVMHDGRITGRFTRSEATPEAIMTCATGSMGAV
ncbi:MAG TPA: sugar ABC transporter ATP-binding protein [Terriglobales bacterium]|nr:sugar ABC transporter ATP-binding protein [Terriglobales bacterium]